MKKMRRLVKFSQQRVKQHHCQNLHRTAEGGEQRIGVIPAAAAEIVFEEIDYKVRRDVHRTVDEDDCHNDRHCLVVSDQGAEHLPDSSSLHVPGGLFADICTGESNKHYE